jgi:hypothetical protein
MRFINSLAALAAALPLAMAGPQAYIKNNCPYPVYLWAVDILRNPTTPTVIPAGGDYSEAYHSLSTGGVSLKLSQTTDRTHPLQFEYTLAGGFIWYDGSHVDCSGAQCPFYAEGVYLESSNPACPKRTCQPNQDCTGFYLVWNDDINTLSCDPSASTNMYLCSTSASGGTAAPAASAAAAPAAASISVPQIASPSVGPKVQMEAVQGFKTGHSKRHMHNHLRRHSHQ